MKKLVAVLLVVSLPALADPPATHFATPSDAPVEAPDVLNVSVHVERGTPVPFAGQLLTDAENMRRGQKRTFLDAELEKAQDDGVLLPKAGVALLISGAAAAVITSFALGIALAVKK